jgi:hypothetical protein
VADVSPAALCNAFRYNYGDLEDCTMLLDIGAKTSNLLFFEKGKVFSRSINIGANSITQDFSNEGKLPFTEAEKLKIAEGFVSLGGAYAEPENPHQAAISKIARQFMTRLHIQVNQTLQFYRGQQGGAAPARLFLSGGASIMPYTAQFFAEKLNVPVEYFNPLRNVQLDPGLNLEELARVAHSFGEVVGLGLRNLAHCPVELNLMPDTTLRWQSFNQKKPYLIATVFSLVLVVCASGWLFQKLAGVKAEELQKLEDEIKPIQVRTDKFRKANKELERAKEHAGEVCGWMEARFFWTDIHRALREAFIATEAKTKLKLGKDTGLWIESMAVAGLAGTSGHAANPNQPWQPTDPTLAPYNPTPVPSLEPGLGIPAPGMPAPGMPAPGMSPDGTMPVAAAPVAVTNEISSLTLNCRAVSMTAVSASANPDIAFALLGELKTIPLFKAEETQFIGNISADEPPGTFTFTVTVKLAKPLKL